MARITVPATAVQAGDLVVTLTPEGERQHLVTEVRGGMAWFNDGSGVALGAGFRVVIRKAVR